MNHRKARTSGCSNESCVTPKFRVIDARLRRGNRERNATDFGPDGFQKILSRLDHSATEQHHVGIDGVHETGCTDREVARRLVHQPHGERIACVGRLVDQTR